MKEPCASCEHKERDLGGCRCQAWLIAHDPAAADPVCSKSPHHASVVEAVQRAEMAEGPQVVARPLVFRERAESLRRATT